MLYKGRMWTRVLNSSSRVTFEDDLSYSHIHTITRPTFTHLFLPSSPSSLPPSLPSRSAATFVMDLIRSRMRSERSSCGLGRGPLTGPATARTGFTSKEVIGKGREGKEGGREGGRGCCAHTPHTPCRVCERALEEP